MSAEAEIYRAAVQAAVERMEGVAHCDVKYSPTSNSVIVSFYGTANDADVYAALNFRQGLARPQGVTLMVYRKGLA